MAQPVGRSDAPALPEGPTDLSRHSWRQVVKRTVREFKDDNLPDWAAALTYHAVLSIFPALLVGVSLLSLISKSAVDTMVEDVTAAAPGSVREILTDAVQGLQEAGTTAGVLAIVGLAVALWSASNYIGAFMRASNAVYDVPEGRPLWKTLPIRLGVTIVIVVLLVLSAMLVVLTGPVAKWVGEQIGAGSTLVAVWQYGKWPVLVVIVALILALLFWAAPNARLAGFRWISLGSLVAVLLWILASAGFAFYVANFASYDKTYGTLGGVIIFLVWLWITNLAILLGAELDAELHRGRAIAAGHPADQEPFVALRDDRNVDDKDAGGL